MQVISIIYADLIVPRKTLDMLNTFYLCCFSVKKKTRNLKTCLTPWEMFSSAQVIHISTTVLGKSKQTTIITQQQKNITEYTSPYHGFNLLLIVLHKNDTKPLFSSHIDQLTTNESLWINKNQIL